MDRFKRCPIIVQILVVVAKYAAILERSQPQKLCEKLVQSFRGVVEVVE